MITELKPNEIFVFGSNLAGRHGAGAALFAVKNFGAIPGKGEGLQGQCYAIPTKNKQMKTLPLYIIFAYVHAFRNCALSLSEKRFLVTPIGCGLAGYLPKDIAPMFRNMPNNVILPEEFLKILATEPSET